MKQTLTFLIALLIAPMSALHAADAPHILIHRVRLYQRVLAEREIAALQDASSPLVGR